MIIMAENADLKTLADIERMMMQREDHTKRKMVGVDEDGDPMFDSAPVITNEALDYVRYSKLKQAAIEWAKMLESVCIALPEGVDTEAIVAYKIRQWIMHFFNLTEEDMHE